MLITLEGIDGSGKTTLWQGLHDIFNEAIFTREPTDSWYGEAVEKSIANDSADPIAELFLYTADHANHLTSVIKPALANDQLIISDRYSDSRYAYQGATLEGIINNPISYIQAVHEPFTREPDLTLYIDISPEIGAKRAGATNKFETVEYLTSVRSNYEHLVTESPSRFVRIDGTEPADQLLKKAKTAINNTLEDSY